MAIAASGQGGLLVRVDPATLREARHDDAGRAHGDARPADDRLVARRRGARANQTPAREVGRPGHVHCQIAPRQEEEEELVTSMRWCMQVANGSHRRRRRPAVPHNRSAETALPSGSISLLGTVTDGTDGREVHPGHDVQEGRHGGVDADVGRRPRRRKARFLHLVDVRQGKAAEEQPEGGRPAERRPRATEAGHPPRNGTAVVVDGPERDAIYDKVVAKYGFMTKVTRFLAKVGGVVKRKQQPYADRAWWSRSRSDRGRQLGPHDLSPPRPRQAGGRPRYARRTSSEGGSDPWHRRSSCARQRP